MKKFTNIKDNILKEFRCNNCGKIISFEGNNVMEDALEVTKSWGYFSKKDGEIHKFDLCENCYDQIVSKFKIKVEKINNSELL